MDNGKPHCIGGWGAVLLGLDDNREVVKYAELKGSKTGTSIGEMELLAAYETLCTLDLEKALRCDIHVISDSQYVVEAFTGGADRWASQGWVDRPNLALIKKMHRLSRILKVNWHWVRGHAGNKYNERADELAKEAKNEEAAINGKVRGTKGVSKPNKKGKQSTGQNVGGKSSGGSGQLSDNKGAEEV